MVRRLLPRNKVSRIALWSSVFIGSSTLGGLAANAAADTTAVKHVARHGKTRSTHGGVVTPAASTGSVQRQAGVAPAKRPAHLVANGDEAVAVTAQRHISHNSEVVVGRAEIEQMVSGSNVLRMLAQVPGVSFSATDALGIDTWGASIYMRGFFMDQLGVTVDGVPLNDQTYTNINGLNVNNAVISDDIDHSSISQGAGAVDLPSNTNLGGTMQFFITPPKDKFGGKVLQGFGSYGMKRTYVRIDSGILNPSGTKFFVDYSRSYEKKYDAPSPAFMQQTDAKLEQPIGERSKMTAFFNWTNAQVWGYADKSLDILNTVGWRTESFYPNYAGAYAAAQWNWACSGLSNPGNSCASSGPITNPLTGQPLAQRGPNQLPAGWENTNETAGVAYYDAGQASTDYIGGMTFDLALTDRLRWITTLYGHSDTSYATYGDPYVPSLTGAPLSEQVWQYRQERYGFNSAFEYKIGKHTINTGAWYENNNQWAGQFWYNEPVLGEGSPLKTVGPYTTYGPAFAQNYGFQWNTNTFQYHVMDTWRPLNNLTVLLGFKSMLQTTSGGSNYTNQESYDGTLPTYEGNLPNGSMTAASAFLPHINVSWHFLPGHELYFDIAENMRPYTVAPTGGSASPWAISSPSGSGVTNQQLFDSIRRSVRPERDWIYLVGYRYNSRLLTASVDAYHADISHRLISASVGSLNNPQTSLLDTRKATMYGMDASATIRPFASGPLRGLSIYNSVSYNHFTYSKNVSIMDGNGDYHDLRGAKMTGYPQVMYKANASYSYKRFNVHFDVNYYSKRPFTLINNLYVPAYWLANTGAQYSFGDYWVLKNVTFGFNVYNLFNAKYIAMMGENGFPVSTDYQSMERGSVREYFGTVSTEF
ncbi:TonB-dependent receptor plug domain-containing protein [Acetobacter sacchari]|uniref:TonB-dependent receptor plug domain-containing protein n=1 Tax=Acetobacter sacchari TaxID=2661687 RepID=A0ABS3LSX6_9PROT|nr:TonB-dependent receptor [Acetobacter sacchari]MBO1359003.1 TonB-dependent receptor plug domain-containing protein [Acetobacter sacchari]